MNTKKTEIIKHLNDSFRRSLSGGQVIITSELKKLGKENIYLILKKVQSFSNFTEGNDPYQEHDFGSISFQEKKIFWKIDYYDKNLEFGSENPADPEVTTRVLTVMLAEEY